MKSMKAISSFLGSSVLALFLIGGIWHPKFVEAFDSRITDPPQRGDMCSIDGLIKWKRDPNSTEHSITGMDKDRKPVCAEESLGAHVQQFLCAHGLGPGKSLFINLTSIIGGRKSSLNSSCVVPRLGESTSSTSASENNGKASNTEKPMDIRDVNEGPPTPTIRGGNLMYFTPQGSQPAAH